jgi:hypothetical protein
MNGWPGPQGNAQIITRGRFVVAAGITALRAYPPPLQQSPFTFASPQICISTHPHIATTSASPQIFKSAYPHNCIRKSSNLQIRTSQPHPHIRRPAHPHIPYIATPFAYFQILKSSNLHVRPLQPHPAIFKSAHPHIIASAHPHIRKSAHRNHLPVSPIISPPKTQPFALHLSPFAPHCNPTVKSLSRQF